MQVYHFEKLQYEDLEWFLSVRNSVRHFLHDTRSFELYQAQTWFKTLEDQMYLKVLHSTNGLVYFPIGYLRFKRLRNFVGEIGLDLDPKFQGKGLSIGAYVAFAEISLAKFNIKFWILRVRKSNIRAISLYKKLGFIELAELNLSLDEPEIFMVANTEEVAVFTTQI